MNFSRFAGPILTCLALLCATVISASAERVYTTGNSDGSIGRRDGYSADYRWNYEQQSRASTTARATHNDFSGYDEHRGPWRHSEISYAALQFPIADLRGRTLAPNSAKLFVYCNSYRDAAPTAELFGASFDGKGSLYAGELGWNMSSFSEWSSIGTISYTAVRNCYLSYQSHLAYMPISPTATWREVDVTADLQRQIDAGYGWAGYFFSMEHAWDGYSHYEFIVATYEDSAHRPYVDYELLPVPEPSSLMALGSGLIGLLGLVRRRK